MKLKHICWHGNFYEHEGHLGWMPFYKAWVVKIFAPNAVKWVPHKQVKFV